MEVSVNDNNVDRALRILKKKMQKERIFKEMKLHSYYEKPSVKKARKFSETIRRWKKQMRKTQEKLDGISS